MLSNKRPDARKSLTAVGKLIREQMPDVYHLVPFLKGDVDTRCPRLGGKPETVVAQHLLRTALQQERR